MTFAFSLSIGGIRGQTLVVLFGISLSPSGTGFVMRDPGFIDWQRLYFIDLYDLRKSSFSFSEVNVTVTLSFDCLWI